MEATEFSSEATPFLRGEQIYLRKVTPSDASGNYLCWVNDREITKYLETGFFPSTTADLRGYIKAVNDDEDVLFLAIVEETEKDHIGNVKMGPIDWIHRRADVGILIGEQEYWNEGIATECLRLVAHHAFQNLNLNKLMAGCLAENKGSKEAFKKAGFEEEGRQEDHAYHEGEYVDQILLGLTRAEYQSIG